MAWYPRFSGNDGLDTVGMEFQENLSGLEVPFSTEPLNYVAGIESRNDNFFQTGSMVQPYQREVSNVIMGRSCFD